MGTVRIIARCPGNSELVLERVKDILEALCASPPDQAGIDRQHWSASLPAWLVSRFAPEPSAEELKEYLKLPYEQKVTLVHDAAWSMSEWLYWFRPENRYWYWWDGIAADAHCLAIAIEVRDWPFPWDALKWLLRAAGATSVEAER
jgi:hypothetical protein